MEDGSGSGIEEWCAWEYYNFLHVADAAADGDEGPEQESDRHSTRGGRKGSVLWCDVGGGNRSRSDPSGSKSSSWRVIMTGDEARLAALVGFLVALRGLIGGIGDIGDFLFVLRNVGLRYSSRSLSADMR